MPGPWRLGGLQHCCRSGCTATPPPPPHTPPPPRPVQVTELAPLLLLPPFLLRRKVLRPMATMAGGSMLGAALAMERGWAINLGGGMHHASHNDVSASRMQPGQPGGCLWGGCAGVAGAQLCSGRGEQAHPVPAPPFLGCRAAAGAPTRTSRWRCAACGRPLAGRPGGCWRWTWMCTRRVLPGWPARREGAPGVAFHASKERMWQLGAARRSAWQLLGDTAGVVSPPMRSLLASCSLAWG